MFLFHAAVLLMGFCAAIVLQRLCFLLVQAAEQEGHDLGAVSYTHLDVYKRQPDQERMNARTEGFEVSLQLHRREQNINAHIPPAPFSAADVQIADRFQMVAF